MLGKERSLRSLYQMQLLLLGTELNEFGAPCKHQGGPNEWFWKESGVFFGLFKTRRPRRVLMCLSNQLFVLPYPTVPQAQNNRQSDKGSLCDKLLGGHTIREHA